MYRIRGGGGGGEREGGKAKHRRKALTKQRSNWLQLWLQLIPNQYSYFWCRHSIDANMLIPICVDLFISAFQSFISCCLITTTHHVRWGKGGGLNIKEKLSQYIDRTVPWLQVHVNPNPCSYFWCRHNIHAYISKVYKRGIRSGCRFKHARIQAKAALANIHHDSAI